VTKCREGACRECGAAAGVGDIEEVLGGHRWGEVGTALLSSGASSSHVAYGGCSWSPHAATPTLETPWQLSSGRRVVAVVPHHYLRNSLTTARAPAGQASTQPIPALNKRRLAAGV